MAHKPLPEVFLLVEKFRYEPETGLLFWRTASKGHKANSQVGWVQPNGYLYCSTPWGKFPVHRIIFKMHTGIDPAGDVDHVNGIRQDNRAINLRECSRSQNLANSALRRDNKIGIKGVAAHGCRFVAHIRIEGKKRHLGVFLTKEEAHAAYLVAAAARSGPFAFGGVR